MSVEGKKSNRSADIEDKINALIMNKMKSLGIEFEANIDDGDELEFTVSNMVLPKELTKGDAAPALTNALNESVVELKELVREEIPKTATSSTISLQEVFCQFDKSSEELEVAINQILKKFKSNNPKVENEILKIQNLLAQHKTIFNRCR